MTHIRYAYEVPGTQAYYIFITPYSFYNPVPGFDWHLYFYIVVCTPYFIVSRSWIYTYDIGNHPCTCFTHTHSRVHACIQRNLADIAPIHHSYTAHIENTDCSLDNWIVKVRSSFSTECRVVCCDGGRLPTKDGMSLMVQWNRKIEVGRVLLTIWRYDFARISLRRSLFY